MKGGLASVGVQELAIQELINMHMYVYNYVVKNTYISINVIPIILVISVMI